MEPALVLHGRKASGVLKVSSQAGPRFPRIHGGEVFGILLKSGVGSAGKFGEMRCSYDDGADDAKPLKPSRRRSPRSSPSADRSPRNFVLSMDPRS